MGRRFIVILATLAVIANCVWAQDLALKGGTILTITDGTIENGTLVIQNGKITAVGKNVKIPSGIKVIDVTGKYIMPGVIDSHSHIALTDVNEAPVINDQTLGPVVENATPASVPWMTPITSVPLSVARETDTKCASIRSSSSGPRGM